MPLETFLVTLEEGAPPQAASRAVSDITRLGGRVEMIAGEGRAIIATFDHALAERVRRLSYVKLVGGVRIRKRTLVRQRK
ncbi:MAG: hypothetical protein PVI07_15175 [Anaerolineae bacterium]|jgi:hypothetical protein